MKNIKYKSGLLFVNFLLLLAMLACNSNPVKKYTPPSDLEPINLSGQVVAFDPTLDTTDSKVYRGCVCCSGNYLFLDDKNFLMIDYCGAENIYSKGMYEIKDSNVILNFDGVFVNKTYIRAYENDSISGVSSEFYIEKDTIEPYTKILTKIPCPKNICFKTDNEKIPFAALDKNLKLSDLVHQIKNDEIWKKLEMIAKFRLYDG